MSGGGSSRGPTITSWLVYSALRSPDGAELQQAGLSVRVAGVGVVQAGWGLRDFRADGVVPLRPHMWHTISRDDDPKPATLLANDYLLCRVPLGWPLSFASGGRDGRNTHSLLFRPASAIEKPG